MNADLLRFTTGFDAFERLASAIKSHTFLPVEALAKYSRIDFVDLHDYEGTDQEWKNSVLSEPHVQSAEVLKPAESRGEVWCSADRHAFVISVFGTK